MEIIKNKLRGKDKKMFDAYLKGDESALENSQCMGSGCFASVYSFGEDKVIKKFSSDGAYTNYLERVVLRSKTRHVPKVFAYAQTKVNSGVVVMEKLKLGESRKQVEALIHTWENGETLPDKKLHSRLKRLKEKCKSHGLYWGDLHYFNVMFRGDGTFVLTDPDA